MDMFATPKEVVRIIVPVILPVLLAATIPLPSYADDFLSEGKRLYQRGEFLQARVLFSKAAQESPKAWQPHYYMANIDLAIGQYASARYEYYLCHRLTNNAAIRRKCQLGSDQAEKRSIESVSYSGSSGSYDNSSVDLDIQKRKAEVMQRAQSECAAIKRAAQSQIDSEKSDSALRFRDENNTLRLDIPQWRKQQILDEAESKCKAVMDNAERSANSYHK